MAFTLNQGLVVDLELIEDAADPCGPTLDEGRYISVGPNVEDKSNDFTQGLASYSADGVYLRYDPVYSDPVGTGYFLKHDGDPTLDVDATGWAGMCEVKFRSKDPNPSINQTIFNKGTIDGDDEYLLIYIQNLNKAYFELHTEDGTFSCMADMPVDPTLARHFFFFGIDPGTGKVWLQVDDGTPVSDDYTGAMSTFVDSRFWIGANRGGVGLQPDYIANGHADYDIRRLRFWAGDCVSFSELDTVSLYNSGSGISLATIELIGDREDCDGNPLCAATEESACTDVAPQMLLVTNDWKVGRWQPTATRDMEVGTDASTGTAIPDWRYSTGFDFQPLPGVVKGLLVDSSGYTEAKVAKTVDAIVPQEARAFPVSPTDGQDEVFIPCAADLRGHKFRVQIDGSNTSEVRSLEWDRDLVESKGG